MLWTRQKAAHDGGETDMLPAKVDRRHKKAADDRKPAGMLLPRSHAKKVDFDALRKGVMQRFAKTLAALAK